MYEHHGSARAAQVTGIPRSTIKRWAHDEQWANPAHRSQPADQWIQPDAPVGDAQGGAAKRLGYDRSAVLGQLADHLQAALTQLEQAQAAGKAYSARAWWVAVGIAVDKCEALADKTAPAGVGPLAPEQAARQREALAAMMTVLARRRDAANGHG